MLFPERSQKKPTEAKDERDPIRKENIRLSPGRTLHMEVRKGPEKRRGEKIRRVSRYIVEDMKRPGEHRPVDPFHYQPHNAEYDEKNDQAVGDIVRSVHESRNCGRIRMPARRKIRVCENTHQGTYHENPEGKHVRENAEEKSQPKINPPFSSENDTTPQSMRKRIHMSSV